MRKVLVVAAFAFAVLGMLAPPVFAQAPAPTVKITGLFDQVTAASANVQDGSFGRTSDKEWYARTRFRPDFSFEVGRTKAVMGLEVDLTYGQIGASGGGPSKNQGAATLGTSGTHPGNTSDAGLNTDTTGVIEIKWMYTEFDLTGKDSLLPFIPVPTVARAGLQPLGSLGNYKVTWANGDFAGLSTVTTFDPTLSLKLAYVMVEDEVAGGGRGTAGGGLVITTGAAAGAGLGAPTGKTTRGNDFAFIISPELTPMKGLDIKPLYSLFYAEGTTSTTARRAAADPRLAGGTTAAAGTYDASRFANGSPTMHEDRHTIGFDARWRYGPYGLEPTIYYQVGTRDVLGLEANGTAHRIETKMSSIFADIIGSFQAGPLLLEARGVYSSGNKAKDNLGKRINYFEVLNTDTSYYSGWTSILGLGVDYTSGCAASTLGMCTNVGYDRYGRAQFSGRATYSMTPNLSVWGVVNPTWTAEKVDTSTGPTRAHITGDMQGDERYIGTELGIGLVWKFAANAAFDLSGSYLVAGKALDTTEVLNGVPTIRSADDGWLTAARVRLSF
jgi:hypothetical protein